MRTCKKSGIRQLAALAESARDYAFGFAYVLLKREASARAKKRFRRPCKSDCKIVNLKDARIEILQRTEERADSATRVMVVQARHASTPRNPGLDGVRARKIRGSGTQEIRGKT